MLRIFPVSLLLTLSWMFFLFFCFLQILVTCFCRVNNLLLVALFFFYLKQKEKNNKKVDQLKVCVGINLKTFVWSCAKKWGNENSQHVQANEYLAVKWKKSMKSFVFFLYKISVLKRRKRERQRQVLSTKRFLARWNQSR